MKTYQARWTCQCGETDRLEATYPGLLSAAAHVIAAAVEYGQQHQRDAGCEEIGVRISEHKEVKDG